jgi:hypothetical protein
MDMKQLRPLAEKLRAAYADQMLAEAALQEARRRQSFWRAEIIAILGQDEAGEFLDLLRGQAGFPVPDTVEEFSAGVINWRPRHG